MRTLYINGFINGKHARKMLNGGRAAFNVMMMDTFRKISKLPEELIKTNITLWDYGGRSS